MAEKTRSPRRALTLAAYAAVGVLGTAGLLAVLNMQKTSNRADPQNAQQVAAGEALYQKNCASCHGANLQGEPNWQTRKSSGLLPAPPHDQSGHTWHHPDAQLFAIIKEGIAAVAPAGYASDMAGYGDRLTDAEIWSVLAYIKSRWPADIQARQAERNKP